MSDVFKKLISIIVFLDIVVEVVLWFLEIVFILFRGCGRFIYFFFMKFWVGFFFFRFLGLILAIGLLGSLVSSVLEFCF